MLSANVILSIAMLAAGALVWGGIVRLRRGGEGRMQGWLMIVCAAVIVGNVLLAVDYS